MYVRLSCLLYQVYDNNYTDHITHEIMCWAHSIHLASCTANMMPPWGPMSVM